MAKLRIGGFAAILATGMTFGAGVPAHAETCDSLVERFNRAIDIGNDAAAQQLADKIATDAECGRYQIPSQRRLAAFRLKAVQLLMARGRPLSDFERLLIAAERPRVLWQASATLGEVRFGARQFGEAAMAFDRAIEIVKNETLTPSAPSPFEIQELVDRSGHARLLAANVNHGSKTGFVKTARNERDGRLGGFYSESVRGVVPRAVPIPITFEYAQTNFTSVGEEAANELVTVLKEQQPNRIMLVGHTDVRGGPDFNMKLSQARAEAVAAFLRNHGIVAMIEVAGKGATQPLHLSDTSGLSQEDIYALNRRVEWLRK
jgi:outer membrane protein OmpA-like peptidoglycan-associated protein